MKISIITVVYNNASTIGDAIDSVLSQNYGNIEYIVIDGGSTDGTVDIIKDYGDKITKFISEPDNGIYDAMNKGFKLTSGDIIGIINSDDFFASDDILSVVAESFKNNDIECLYADLEYVDTVNTDKSLRKWKSKPYSKKLFAKGWHPAHPTFYAKRSAYEEYGYFKTELTIAADYELMLRFLEKFKSESLYIPKVFVKMRTGGESNKSFRNILKANIQCYKSWKLNGLKVSPLIILRKPFFKLFQYL
jgi:glycosyltransferase